MRSFRLIERVVAGGILTAIAIGFGFAAFMLIHAKLAAAGFVAPLGWWF